MSVCQALDVSSLRLSLSIVLLALGACSQSPAQQEPVRAVKVLTVGVGQLGSSPEFAGEVKARVEAQLAFRVGGKLVRRQADAGQRVSAGAVLAQLDPQDLRLGADAARAQVVAAQTSWELAAADFKRFAALKEQNFISGADLERRETTLKAAKAQLDQARAQLSAQSNQAGYATLIADFAGVITAVSAEPGQVVSAGAPVIRIAQDGPRDVVFAVPEDKVATVQPGSDVTVQVWSGNRTLAGKVREVAASADPVTRTYLVKVALVGPDAPPLGSTVSVTPSSLSRTGASVIKLPTSALRQEGGATAVWVLEPSTMTLRSQTVQVATADGNDAVISSGLQPGMLVVSAGVHVLSPGQKVTLYRDRQTAANLAAAPMGRP